VPQRLLSSVLLATAAMAALLSACGDDPIRPEGLLDIAEAEALLRSARALPTVGELAERAVLVDPDQRAALLHAQELWAAGTAADHGRGLAQRRLGARYAAPVLARTLAPDEWAGVRAGLEHWILAAEGMLHHLALPPVDERLRSARDQLRRADAATVPESRVYHLLLTLSDLVETTPGYVSRTLVREADAAVVRAEARLDGDPAPPALVRARRLADWAAKAEAEQDHLRAIQRAYYAIQLVENR
jgi:hypothetical protein